MAQKKSLPPHIAAKIMSAMKKAGAISYYEIDGTSMQPFIMNRERVIIDHRKKEFAIGDIIHFKREGEKGTFLHRIVFMDGDKIITKGDNRYSLDKPITKSDIKGKVTTIERIDGTKIFLEDEPYETFSCMMAEVSYRMGIFHREMMKEKFNEDDKNVEADAELLHINAYDLYHNGEQEKALDLFRQATALDPTRAISRVDIGEILRQKGEGDEAILHLRLALDIDRRNSKISAQAYNIIGNTFCDRGEYQESLEEYLSSIDVSPDFVPPYINRGWAYYKLGEYEKAMEDYNKAIEIEPENYKAIKNLGLLYLTMKDMENALKHLEKAREINGKDPDVLNNLGVIFMEKGENEKAGELFNRAMEVDPTHYDTTCNIGTILERTGRKDEAVRHYTWALKKFPGDEHFQACLTRLIKAGVTKNEE